MKYIDLKQKQIHENKPPEVINISKGWSNLRNSPRGTKSRINITKNISKTYITKNYTQNITKNLITQNKENSLIKNTIIALGNILIIISVVVYKTITSIIKLIISLLLLIGVKLSNSPSPKWYDKLMDKMNKTGGKYEN